MKIHQAAVLAHRFRFSMVVGRGTNTFRILDSGTHGGGGGHFEVSSGKEHRPTLFPHPDLFTLPHFILPPPPSYAQALSYSPCASMQSATNDMGIVRRILLLLLLLRASWPMP